MAAGPGCTPVVPVAPVTGAGWVPAVGAGASAGSGSPSKLAAGRSGRRTSSSEAPPDDGSASTRVTAAHFAASRCGRAEPQRRPGAHRDPNAVLGPVGTVQERPQLRRRARQHEDQALFRGLPAEPGPAGDRVDLHGRERPTPAARQQGPVARNRDPAAVAGLERGDGAMLAHPDLGVSWGGRPTPRRTAPPERRPRPAPGPRRRSAASSCARRPGAGCA